MGSLERFFDDYVHDDEWGLELFQMYSVAHLPELMEAVSRLVKGGTEQFMASHHTFAPETSLEYVRKVRAYYMHDMAVNIFYCKPERRGYLMLNQPDQK